MLSIIPQLQEKIYCAYIYIYIGKGNELHYIQQDGIDHCTFNCHVFEMLKRIEYSNIKESVNLFLESRFCSNIQKTLSSQPSDDFFLTSEASIIISDRELSTNMTTVVAVRFPSTSIIFLELNRQTFDTKVNLHMFSIIIFSRHKFTRIGFVRILQ